MFRIAIVALPVPASATQKIELPEIRNIYPGAAASALTCKYEAGKAGLAMVLKAKRGALSARISLAQERAEHSALVADFNHYIVGERL